MNTQTKIFEYNERGDIIKSTTITNDRISGSENRIVYEGNKTKRIFIAFKNDPYINQEEHFYNEDGQIVLTIRDKNKYSEQIKLIYNEKKQLVEQIRSLTKKDDSEYLKLTKIIYQYNDQGYKIAQFKTTRCQLDTNLSNYETIIYEYDEYNNCVCEYGYSKNKHDIHFIKYNNKGQKIKVDYVVYNNSTVNMSANCTYSYNEKGLCSNSITNVYEANGTHNRTTVINYEYDDNNKLIKEHTISNSNNEKDLATDIIY